MGYHSLLQGIVANQGSNLSVPALQAESLLSENRLIATLSKITQVENVLGISPCNYGVVEAARPEAGKPVRKLS